MTFRLGTVQSLGYHQRFGFEILVVAFPPGTVLSLGYHQSFGFEGMAAESPSSVTLEMLQHLLHFQKLPLLEDALFPLSTQERVRF